jgi:hypothetical protein
MRSRFAKAIPLFAFGAVVLIPGKASAATPACGSLDGNGDPIEATLVFVPEGSNDYADFADSRDDRTFRLKYNVSGCVLQEAPTVENISGQLGDTTLVLSTPRFDRQTLTIDGVMHSSFNPGEYILTISTSGDQVLDDYHKVTVKRTFSPWTLPWGLAVLGAIVGVIWAYLNLKSKVGINAMRWLAAIVAAGAAAYPILNTMYDDKTHIWGDSVPADFFVLPLTIAAAAAGVATTAFLVKNDAPP